MRKRKIRWVCLPLLMMMIMAMATVMAHAQTEPQEVSDWNTLKTIMTADGEAEVVLTEDIVQPMREKLVVNGEKSLDLNGHTFDAGALQRSMEIKGTLTMEDSSRDATGRYFGGWEKGITIQSGGKLIIHSGTYSTNGSQSYVLIWVNAGGVCSMDGGVLRNNRYAVILKAGGNGGDSLLHKGGILELGGEAKIIKNGIGVQIENNMRMLNDGYHLHYSSLVLKDGAVTIDQNGQNVIAYRNMRPRYDKITRPIQIEGDITGSRIGFQATPPPVVNDPGAVTNGYAEHCSGPADTWFFTDVSGHSLEFAEDGDILIEKMPYEPDIKEVESWSELKEAIANAESAKTTIKLTQDITAEASDDPIAISGDKDIQIDFQGHTIDRGRSDLGPDGDGYVIISNGALSLISSTGTGTITGGYAVNGGAIYNGGVLSIKDVDLTGNKASEKGGAVYNAEGGTLILNDCVLSDNEAQGLGNDVYNKGLVRIGDSRTGRNTTVKAGEIYLAENTKIDIAGGLNTAGEGGGIGISMENMESQLDPDGDPVDIPFTRNYSLHNPSTHPADCFHVADAELAEDNRIVWDHNRNECIIHDNYGTELYITYHPNGGTGASYRDEKTADFGKAYVSLNANSFVAPDGMEFAGWLVGDEVYQPGEYVWFDSDTTVKASWKKKPALTIVATSPDEGVEADLEPMSIDGISSGMIYRDVLDANESAISEHFAKEGYEFVQYTPGPLDEYDSWKDVPGDGTTSEFMNTQITGDTVIYAVMAKPLSKASLSIEKPVCGTEVKKADDPSMANPSTAENSPVVTLPETAAYEVEDPETEHYSKYWVESEGNNPFYGKMTGGQKMKAHIQLIPQVGYVFTNDPEINVEGGTYIEDDVSPWDGSNYRLLLNFSVPVVHPEMTGEEAKECTCTEGGNAAYWVCPTCEGHFKDAEGNEAFADEEWILAALGHDWSEWTVTKEPTEIEKGSRIHKCNRCGYEEAEEIPAKGYASGGDPNQKGTDGTAVGPSASAAAADRAIAHLPNDNDPAGSVYGKLQAKSTKQTKNSVNVKWNKVKGATKYVIYGNACGKKIKMKKLATSTGKAMTFKKIAGKKVKKGTYYKFIIVALDKNNNVVSTSKIVHVATKGGKVGNHKSVTVKKSVLKKAKKLKKGKSLKLKAKAVKASKLKVKKHRAVSYESSNPKIATVSKKGVVKGKNKGSCYIYAYAQNGVAKKIKIVIK